jgi:methyltransferase OMS1, mitochondrial
MIKGHCLKNAFVHLQPLCICRPYATASIHFIILGLSLIQGAMSAKQSRPFKNKRGAGPFLFMGIATFMIAGYGSYEIAIQKRRNIEYQTRLSKGEVMSTENWNPTETYNRIADEYDAATQEFLLGITFMRWWATSKAGGKVLEVCAGTGKNVPYYDLSKVKEIHFLDQSKGMLEKCKEKWDKRTDAKIPVSFLVSSIESFPVPSEKYDTIYQTQGLCSCANPVEELRKLQSLVKPNGTIILIEHGLGYYKWVNSFLDTVWEDHAKKWGCITNRNIGAVVRDSGLVVRSKSRWLFGTTWVITGSSSPEITGSK